MTEAFKETQPVALPAEKLSRRALARIAAVAGVAGLLPAEAAAKTGADATRVFDPTRLGRLHTLASTPQTIRSGVLDPAAKPVLTIRSGDVVHYPDTWLHWGNKPKYGMSFEEREPIRKQYREGPFSLIGPVAVEGAEPGDTIECRMLRLRPIDWGWNSAPLGVGAIPEDFDKPYLKYFRFDADRKHAEFAPGIRLKLAPFQGVMATQPNGEAPISAILTGDYGGNILMPELGEGTSLFLPVQQAGGNLWTGDSNAVQGDGVVNQTAIETAMEDLRIQYVLHKGVRVPGPMGETSTHWAVLGYGDSLDDAMVMAVRRMVARLSEALGLDKGDAYSITSLAGSFRASQFARQSHTNYVVKPAKAVQGLLPKAIFSADHAARISNAIRTGGM